MSGRWIALLAIIAWLVQRQTGAEVWLYFGIFVGLSFLFRREIQQVLQFLGLASAETTEKRKNTAYKDVGVTEFDNDNDDGLTRRIIRASDGEILVAVEDPETGALYLEENG